MSRAGVGAGKPAKKIAGKRVRAVVEPEPESEPAPEHAAAAATAAAPAAGYEQSAAAADQRRVAIALAANQAAAAQPPQPARKPKKSKSERKEESREFAKNIFGLWDSADELSGSEDEDGDEEEGMEMKDMEIELEAIDSEDRRPAAGRFSTLVEDEYDRQCVPQKLKKLSKSDMRALKKEAIKRVRKRDAGQPTAAEAKAKAAQVSVVMEDVPAEEEHMEPEPSEDAKLGEEMALQGLIDSLAELALHDEKLAEERMRINTRENLSCDLLRDQRMCKGDLILDAIRKCLNNLGYTRSTFQQARTHPNTQSLLYSTCLSIAVQRMRVCVCVCGSSARESRWR